MSETAPISLFLPGLSRHGYAYEGADGKIYLSLPERLPHEPREDSIPYECNGSEYLFNIACAFYRGLFKNPEDVAEIIAEFQEDPIIDISVPPPQGTILQLPSPEYILQYAYGDSLSDIPDL